MLCQEETEMAAATAQPITPKELTPLFMLHLPPIKTCISEIRYGNPAASLFVRLLMQCTAYFAGACIVSAF
jgi:hypothetical protein